MTFEKYARSPAEWLESFYHCLVTKQAWKYEKLNEKHPHLCHFLQSSSVQCDQFTQVCRTIHKLVQNSKSQQIIYPTSVGFFPVWEVNNIQIFIYYGHDLSQQLPQPWLCWPPPWKLKPIISYFPDYYKGEQGRLIFWHFKRYLISVWCRAVQFSHKEAALNEHLNDLQMKFGPMRFRVQQVWAKHHMLQSQVWGEKALKPSLVKGVEESDHCVLFGCGFESKCFANLWLEG